MLLALYSWWLVPHVHGHILDLVLSCGVPVFNVEVCDAVFSDHAPVLFDISLNCHTIRLCASARICRIIKPFTAAQFSTAFDIAMEMETLSTYQNTELTSSFLSICKNILDTVAPFKSMRPKPKSEPWLNDKTLLLDVSADRPSANGKKTSCRCHMIFLKKVGRRLSKLRRISLRCYLEKFTWTSCSF